MPLDLDAALEHLAWVRERQAAGYLVLRALHRDKRLKARKFFDNERSTFVCEIRLWLEEHADQRTHIFYGVNAFTEKQAKAEFVVESRLAHVDADGVGLPPPGPPPTRIIRTSAQNAQFLYEIDEFVPAATIELISKGLTKLVGGDIGGHSCAKLLRLPGTLNPKYDPPQLVVLHG